MSQDPCSTVLSAEALADLVRDEIVRDEIIQTVRVEGIYSDRARYVCIVCAASGPATGREFCLLGIDCSDDGVCTIGLVVKIVWDTKVSLDGDGGFSLFQLGRHFIFKPVSVQALWRVIQTLHMILERTTPRVLEIPDGDWVKYYERSISSPQSCLNEWHEMTDLLVRRPPSPEGRDKVASDTDPETVIKSKLREIMKTVDLDTITSKGIRKQLEGDMKESLEDYKSFIDKEILVILGQMDPASQIDTHLYLGSEWNASNLEELMKNGITHILNVTREIDNFFPGVFKYMNIRVYDEEATDLLKYLDKTYRFIKETKDSGGKVLVHCKMGISRSATATIAFMMKEYDKSLQETLEHVKSRRSIVNPNKAFRRQLEVYEGMLGAIRHRLTYGLSRSKSESSFMVDANDDKPKLTIERSAIDIKMLALAFSGRPNSEPWTSRPKSWSPSEKVAQFLLPGEDEDEEDEDNECQCFGEVSKGHDEPSRGFRQDSTSSSSSTSDAIVEARNVFIPSVEVSPVNKARAYDPQCGCDVELELGVPDDPVSIHADDDRSTDAIVQNLSNMTLQIRDRVPDFVRHSHPPSRVGSFSDASGQQSNEEPASEDDVRRRTTSEELSVKTLASMFNFKIGSIPYSRPYAAKLEDNKLFKKASQKLSNDEHSEC